jgi:hypothetical protein
MLGGVFEIGSRRPLTSATVMPVSVAGHPYELLARSRSGDRRDWLCQPPSRVAGSPGVPGTPLVVSQYDWLRTDEKLPLPGEALPSFVTVAI